VLWAFAQLLGGISSFVGKKDVYMQMLRMQQRDAETIKSAERASSRVFVSLWAIGMCSAVLPMAAQDLTPAVWAPYTDRYGIIHNNKVNDHRDPSSDNGQLFTAEACVIMELSHVSYDKGKIAAGLKADQVKPGLYNRSPIDLKGINSVDNYIGLGALAGVCGFHDVARDILNYGRGGDQASGPAAALLAGSVGQLTDELKQCRTVAYNYNNVEPGKFTFQTWMGKYPAMLVHWKLAAGDQPDPSEFGLWGAALILSAKKGDQDGWIQSWLMILTYEMSQYHSTVADFAVGQWWTMLHSRYPGGIKQTMTDYLGSSGKGNPLEEYIQDFQPARNPSATIVDSNNNPGDLLGSAQGLMTTGCGLKLNGTPCIDYSDFSPTNLLAPFTMALSTSASAVDVASMALSNQQHLVDLQVASVNQAAQVSAGLTNSIADFQTQHTALQQRAASFLLQKAILLAKGLDKLHLPGHIEEFCPAPKIFGHCPVPVILVPVPGPTQDNPDFENAVKLATEADNQANAIQNLIDQSQKKLATAQQDLANKTAALNAVKAPLDQLQSDLTKTKASLELAKGALQVQQALVQNLNVCVH
jgi:hypothetical protein